MSGKLPQRIDPFRAAEQGRILKGEVPVRQLPRLLEAVVEPGKDLCVEFRFKQDAGGRSFVELACQSVLILRCERCLGNIEFGLDLHHHLTLIDAKSEQEPQIDDVVIVEEEGLFLRNVLEDEILLDLPLIPRHSNVEACDQAMNVWIKSPVDPETPSQEMAPNPFEILRTLKD